MAPVIVPLPVHSSPPRALCYCDTGTPVPEGTSPGMVGVTAGGSLAFLAVALMALGMASDVFGSARWVDGLMRAAILCLAASVTLGPLAALVAWAVL